MLKKQKKMLLANRFFLFFSSKMFGEKTNLILDLILLFPRFGCFGNNRIQKVNFPQTEIIIKKIFLLFFTGVFVPTSSKFYVYEDNPHKSLWKITGQQ